MPTPPHLLPPAKGTLAAGRGTPRTRRAKNHGAKNPGQKRPRVQSTRAHAHRPRTRNADAKRGRNRTNAARGARLQQPQQQPNAGQLRSREGRRPPGPGRGDHQRPAPKYPREKFFTAGGPYKVPARAAHVIPRRQSTQANRTHAAPARKAALSSIPARRSAAADPPARKTGLFPFRPNRRGARTKQRNPRARAAALPAQARDPAPTP